jgi:hypothetical protein
LTGSGTTARKPLTNASVAANTTAVAAILPFFNPAIFIVVRIARSARDPVNRAGSP